MEVVGGKMYIEKAIALKLQGNQKFNKSNEKFNEGGLGKGGGDVSGGEGRRGLIWSAPE